MQRHQDERLIGFGNLLLCSVLAICNEAAPYVAACVETGHCSPMGAPCPVVCLPLLEAARTDARYDRARIGALSVRSSACGESVGLLARLAPALPSTPAPSPSESPPASLALAGGAGFTATGVQYVAAFSAVLSCCQFAAGLFNFLVSVVMTHCSRTIGAKAWHQLGPRIWMAVFAALACGALVSGVLLISRSAIFRLLSLSPGLVALASPLFTVAACTIPATFLNRVVTGVLGGLGQLAAVCVLNVAGAGRRL